MNYVVILKQKIIEKFEIKNIFYLKFSCWENI